MQGMESIGRTRACRLGRFGLRLIALCCFGLPASWAQTAAPAAFVLGTDLEETKPFGKWYRRIYGEAFRRMGVPLTVMVAPTARLTLLVDQGEIQGQASRVFGYADAHPDQLRVDEVLHEVRLALFAFGPARADAPRRLEDLAAGPWRAEYRRGVAICEKTLKPILPAEHLSDVSNVEQALLKLKAGRTDLYCDFDASVRNELLMPAFKESISGYRQAIDLKVGLPLYPYVHKSRAELVPQLARTLRKMKAEGLIERYLREVEDEAAH